MENIKPSSRVSCRLQKLVAIQRQRQTEVSGSRHGGIQREHYDCHWQLIYEELQGKELFGNVDIVCLKDFARCQCEGLHQILSVVMTDPELS